MHNILRRALACCIGLSAASAHANVFTVDILFDGNLDHDTTPGDGICDSNRGTSCSLRAAIEEANARGGPDIIVFSVAGTIVPSTEGPLPVITDALTINGTTAPGYVVGATDIGAAPPVVFIDGTFLSGTSADGLRFNNGAADSRVRGIGIVNMPDKGIEVMGDAHRIHIEANWIGLKANGGLGGNGGGGVYVDVGNASIGMHTTVASGLVALGNLIAGNGGNGITLQAQSFGATVHGNSIGYAPNGLSPRGNGAYGVQTVAGMGHKIGGIAVDGSNGGNRIGANALGGIQMFGTRNAAVQSNRLGSSSDTSNDANPGAAILVIGESNHIGGNVPAHANRIIGHQDGIRLGFGSLVATDALVENNIIGSNVFDIGVARHGIWIDNGGGNVVRQNDLWHVTSDGIRIDSDDNTAQGNRIGYRNDILEGVVDVGASTGIRVSSDLNTIDGNIVGFSTGNAILVNGRDNDITSNHLGVTPLGHTIANGASGIAFADSIQQPIGNLVRGNVIRNNGAQGIVVRGDGTALGNRIELNRIWMNAGPAIDLVNTDGSGFGINANDPGDADEGVNRLLNAPVIHSAAWSMAGGAPQVTVQFSVDALPANAAYPMYVDVYLGSAGLTDARDYLPSDEHYSTPGVAVSRTYALPAGTQGGHVVAMAIDAGGNSSEVSWPLAFGNPDALFADGFEPPL